MLLGAPPIRVRVRVRVREIPMLLEAPLQLDPPPDCK